MEQEVKYEAGDAFGVWAILELMGHRKIAGFVTEEERFGTKMLRIDIPGGEQMTQYYGGQAVYCMTPTTEEIARRFAAKSAPRPVYVYELRLPEPTVEAQQEPFGWEDEQDLASPEL